MYKFPLCSWSRQAGFLSGEGEGGPMPPPWIWFAPPWKSKEIGVQVAQLLQSKKTKKPRGSMPLRAALRVLGLAPQKYSDSPISPPPPPYEKF